jgi:hypothetical protein
VRLPPGDGMSRCHLTWLRTFRSACVAGLKACSYVALVLAFVAPARAQQMPEPSMIHGKALPAPELPNGTVTVRVVRESIGNNISGQPVTLTATGRTRTASTDDLGRAEFTNLPVGQEGRAAATVDGETLQSDPFTIPASGGLRVILVAGIAKAAERKAAEAAQATAAPPIKGSVVFGANSRILTQFSNDALQVYYVLEVVNSARNRVDIGGPLVIDLPPGVSGLSALEGSSPSVTVAGDRITVAGPFAPGTTPVQVGYRLLYSGGTVTLSQSFPAPLQQITVGVQKLGALSVSSPQFTETRDVTAQDGKVFALGNGGALAAGTPLTLTLTNLPHHSLTPRFVTLGLAGAVIALGVWLSARRGNLPDARSLSERREQLLKELTQLELRRREGAVSAERFASRRRRLIADLEQIYGEIDGAVAGPQGGGEGVAA